MKKYKFSITLAFLFIISLVSIAVAVDYSTDDTGDIVGTQIFLDGEWYLRPGLNSFPSVSGPGEYDINASLLSGTSINEVVLHHGPPDGSSWETISANITTSGNIEVSFTPDEGTFYYCQPQWDYAFYLNGYQYGSFIENDERHYADGSGGGDPYVFTIQNPNINQPPVADPGGPYVVDRFYNEFVTLDGSGSLDPEDLEGLSLTYAWDVYVTWEEFQPLAFEQDDEFDDGIGPNPDIFFDESGYYHVRLKVTDECGEENIAETYLMVYDPSIVVIPQENHIAGLNWHKGMELTLYLDEEFVATLPVQGPEEGLPEKDGYQAGFQLNDYGIEAILPGTNVKIVGEVIGEEPVIREHVVRDFWFDVDYENDVVFGWAEIRLPSPPEENYVRVRIEDPYHVEIQEWVDEDGNWSADFREEDGDGDGIPAGEDPDDIDLTEETSIVVLQQNYYDSSHTFRYLPEESPHPGFIVQPDHGWAFGYEWPLDVEVTLLIDEDTNPNNGIIFTDTATTIPAEWNPNIGMVNFEFWEIAEQVQPGQYVSMSDGETTKDTFIYDMAFETLDPASETASGYGPANRPGHIHIESAGFGYDYDLPPEENDGSWTANFSGQGIDFSHIQDANIELKDDDNDGTVAHLQLESIFLGGEIAPNPVPIGEPVTITAEYLQGYYPIETMEISFFQTDPPEWIALDFDVVDDQATGTTTLPFDEPGVYPVGTRAFTTQGQESGGFLGFLVVYDPEKTIFLGGEISPNPVPVGEQVTITAEFLYGDDSIEKMEISSFQTNPPESNLLEGPMGDHQAKGTTTITFDQPGVYPVEIQATTTQENECTGFLGLLVVYDPNGGFVTGGGTIWSPKGAYYPDPDLEGKANFGFVSKYKKGADVPTGQTEFQLNLADLNFHTTSYDWLVVAGKKAMYKGSGTINGEGDYKFMISAIDGDLKGGDGIDKFSIRIWEEVDGMEVVIYDNQLGDWLGLDADPSTAIINGSIQTHKSK